MTHNIIDLYGQFQVGLSHVVTNVSRKHLLTGPLESDIGKVWICRKKPPRIRSIHSTNVLLMGQSVSDVKPRIPQQ